MQTNLPKHPVIPKIVYHLINRVENNASSTRLSTRPVELLFSTCETAPGEPCCLPDQREDTKKMELGSWSPVIWCDMMWNKGPRSEHRKFWLDIGKMFYHEVVKYWNSLSREAVEPPSLGVFKTELDTALSNLFWIDLLWAVVG